MLSAELELARHRTRVKVKHHDPESPQLELGTAHQAHEFHFQAGFLAGLPAKGLP
jgi:hypothetical protein